MNICGAGLELWTKPSLVKALNKSQTKVNKNVLRLN